MEEAIIRQEFDRSYVLFPMKEEQESFPAQMIMQNDIAGFLSCKQRFVEEVSYYGYDITSKKSLESEYRERKIGFMDLQEIFYGLSSIMKTANEFLLPREGFLLHPQYIFRDLEKEDLYCLYLPTLVCHKQEEGRTKYRDMADFLLDKIDHKDEHAVNVAYQFYKMSKETFFSFEVFMGFMEKEALLAQSRERQKPENRKEGDFAKERGSTLEEEIVSLSDEEHIGTKTWKWWIPVVLLVIGISLSGLYLLIPALRAYALYILVPGAGFIGFAVIMGANLLYHKFTDHQDEWEEPAVPVRVEDYFDDLMDSETVFFDEEISVCLKWKEGHFSREHYLKEFPVTVGKMKDSVQICIEDPSVSRLHARFHEKKGDIFLQDLDSTNGTYVNGKRLAAGEEVHIGRNDEIQFGKIIVNVV